MTPSAPDPLRSLRLLRNVMVPMRDGVRLATTVYLPRGEGRYPAVLVRNAYNRAWPGPGGIVERGMALVVQDVRGRYASEGEFYPFTAEPEDGYDTLDWLAAQPWCDGRIGMFGDSYLGGVQFAVAPLNHPNLVSLNPRFMSTDLWRQGYYCDGVFSAALTFSWLCLEVGSRTSEAHLLPHFNIAGLVRHVPLLTLDETAGGVTPAYRDYAEHYARDAFWQAIDYRGGPSGGLRRCRTPMLLTGGWYDYYPNEAFRGYEALMSADADEAVRRAHRVLIGPWTHGVHAGSVLGDLDFGPAATAENDATFRWLDATLKGGGAAAYREAPIRLFVMGENAWRDEREWPLARTRWTDIYLHSAGGANTAAGDGALSPEPPAQEAADRFAYDPADPVPTLGGNHSVGPYNPGLYEMCLPGPKEQGPTERRADVLVYTSAPLDADLELTGPVSLRLFAASSARDTDFTARLADVYPDGRSFNITEGVIRARFRARAWDRPELMEPGRTYEFVIKLQPTSNVFKAGHRLRLQISSSNFPLWSRNLNTGGHPAHETEMVVAEQTVFHDAGRPSRLTLPVIPRG